MSGYPFLSVMVLSLDDQCAMTANSWKLSFLLKSGVSDWLFHCTTNVNVFSLPRPAISTSCKNSPDLQHWNEEQDEGAHDDGRRDVLEVDLPEHSCTCDWHCCVPLEHGGRLAACESLWSTLQPGRLPNHQLSHWCQAEVALANWHLSPGNAIFVLPCVVILYLHHRIRLKASFSFGMDL